MLVETRKGRSYSLYHCDPPLDCVIHLSANGYWQPQGSYPKDEVTYELTFNKEGKTEPMIGYEYVDNTGGVYKSIADFREFLHRYMCDPIVYEIEGDSC